jgi:hypothetical protein
MARKNNTYFIQFIYRDARGYTWSEHSPAYFDSAHIADSSARQYMNYANAHTNNTTEVYAYKVHTKI